MAVAEIKRHRFTVDDYERMVDSGILVPDQRIELIDGEILTMAAIGSRHAVCLSRLTALFHRAGPDAIIRPQSPIRIAPWSEPEPDLALVAPRPDDYVERHPEPAEVLLLLEISDTSLHSDETVELPIYAEAGVDEVWIVDLQGGQVLVHRRPGATGYENVTRHGAGERVSPLAFPDLEIPVDDVLV